MATAHEPRPVVLRVGALALDRRSVVVTVGGAAASLSRTEFVLLAALMERAGEGVSRRALAEAVWGEQLAAEGHVIDQSVYSLRLKLRRAASEAGVPPPTIAWVRGLGYCLTA